MWHGHHTTRDTGWCKRKQQQKHTQNRKQKNEQQLKHLNSSPYVELAVPVSNKKPTWLLIIKSDKSLAGDRGKQST